MADIKAVVIALQEGNAARRPHWGAETLICLSEEKLIIRRLARASAHNVREIPVEMDWADLSATDWDIVPAPPPIRKPSSNVISSFLFH